MQLEALVARPVPAWHISPRLHRVGQLLGPVKRRDEQRHDERKHRTDLLLQRSAAHIDAAGCLCLHDALCLFDQRRNEAQCDGDHHRDLMRRDTDAAKRLEQIFDAQRQIQRLGRRRQDGGDDDH